MNEDKNDEVEASLRHDVTALAGSATTLALKQLRRFGEGMANGVPTQLQDTDYLRVQIDGHVVEVQIRLVVDPKQHINPGGNILIGPEFHHTLPPTNYTAVQTAAFLAEEDNHGR